MLGVSQSELCAASLIASGIDKSEPWVSSFDWRRLGEDWRSNRICSVDREWIKRRTTNENTKYYTNLGWKQKQLSTKLERLKRSTEENFQLQSIHRISIRFKVLDFLTCKCILDCQHGQESEQSFCHLCRTVEAARQRLWVKVTPVLES